MIVDDEDMRWVRHGFFLSHLFGGGQTHFCHRLYQAPSFATDGYNPADAQPSFSISYADVTDTTKHGEAMMSKFVKTTCVLALITTTAGMAYADAGHHGADKPGAGQVMPQNPAAKSADMGPAGMMGQAAMMGGDHHEMMQGMMKMMMQMHGGMMGGGMNQMGAAGTMGGTGPMGMMDQDMMALMRGPMMGRFDADADGDGLISGEEAHGKLQSMHADADTNGDGSLTLEEFEALHGEIIRSMMVDRFQHLDTDGDGLVTSGEMTAPADRMGMRPPIQGMMGDKMGTQDN
ncbi:EF-hand domain-containing protein [Actibacterium atlanticum]|nr:hypothetical protein [Actibacterium atlanticum]